MTGSPMASESPRGASISPPPASKRKLINADDDAKTRKKAKRKQSKKAAKAKVHAREDDIDDEAQINLAIGKMDPSLISDHMARQVRQFEPSLTLVELEDLLIPQRAFLDTTTWSKPRTIDGLPEFIENYTAQSRSDLCKAPAAKGSPHTIVLCPAALRAANVVRALRCYQTAKATVAKLFAKHIKLSEAVNFTKETRMSVAVGTPQRLSDLHDAGALSTSNLALVVIDGSWSGPKKRTIFEMPEALTPSARFLARSGLKGRLVATPQTTSLVVF